ncbi:N-acetyl-gamma-glutamyl-phosphate reductase [Candidatus Micrarchaeota archaeon]|nr:N-acetyl-gamma-glutamyl-phosphate reductase [Candidatus Micrarchaeota archaeon]
MKKVGVIGTSGIVAQELLSILHQHPGVQVTVMHSTGDANSVWTPQTINDEKLDLAFLCGPASTGMQWAKMLDSPLIDLGPDFRFQNQETYQATYQQTHTHPEKADYGLPELFPKTKNRITANPGCYATASLLALKPLDDAGLLEKAVIDGKSGYSGAGKKTLEQNYQEKIRDNAWPYHVTGHRHEPEIQQFLSAPIHFTPHVLPVYRGMLCTIHAFLQPRVTKSDVQNAYQAAYQNQPLIRIQDEPPNLRDTQHTHHAVLGGFALDRGCLVVICSIDNLGKGAASQAVQNMNRRFGINEQTGLIHHALS